MHIYGPPIFTSWYSHTLKHSDKKLPFSSCWVHSSFADWFLCGLLSTPVSAVWPGYTGLFQDLLGRGTKLLGQGQKAPASNQRIRKKHLEEPCQPVMPPYHAHSSSHQASTQGYLTAKPRAPCPQHLLTEHPTQHLIISPYSTISQHCLLRKSLLGTGLIPGISVCRRLRQKNTIPKPA